MENFSADLTRFDFHVNRFLGSEDVQQMTAEEVGQYILLLCEAWRLHKGASLPKDKQYLSRVARVKTVSPRVMKKFHTVEIETSDGTIEVRIRNQRLYEEWQKAVNRYQKFSKGARKTNETRWGSESPSDSPSDSGSERQATAIPYQSIPDHSVPDQKEVNAAEKTGKEMLAARARRLQVDDDE